MMALWTTVRESATKRLGRRVLTGYAILFGIGVIVVVVAIVIMRR
jgi:hypothetical protein